MKPGGRRRLLILISAMAALALTSTAMGQVIINNTYSLQVSQIIPEANLTSDNLNVTTNAWGTVAYVNLSEVFPFAGHQTSKNLSNIFFLTSDTPGSFFYTVNVTNFTGSGHLSQMILYSTNSTGSYVRNYVYSSTNGTTAGTTPTGVNPDTSTGVGLYLSVGNSDTGSHTWELELQINGYFTGANSSKVVFTQYYVHFLITTTEVP